MPALSAVYSNYRRARTAFKDVGRLRVILAILLRHGFGYALERWRARDRTLFQGLAPTVTEGATEGEARRQTGGERVTPPPETASAAGLASRLRRVLEDLGPTFIKLGQILSTRADLVPPELLLEFAKLQSQVAPLPFAQIREQLARELGRPPEELFAFIDERPLAAASIAQVHRATLADGSEVVVKVQRPGVEELMLNDLSLLELLAREIGAGPAEAAGVDLLGTVRELERAVRRELDFAQELRNLQRFARIFGSFPEVCVPRPFPELSSRRVLTMEYVHGVRVTEAVRRGDDRKRLTGLLLRSVFHQIFVAGTFHGDLHPGNLLVLEDGTLCYLDLGLVGHLPALARDRIADLLVALIRGDTEAVTQALCEIAIKDRPADRDRLVEEVEDLLDLHLRDRALQEIQLGAVLWDVLQRGAQHGLRMPPAYTMMLRALVTAEGLGHELAPDLDLFAELRPYLEDLLRRRYDPQRLTRELMSTALETSRLLQALPSTLNRLMAQAEGGGLRLGVELAGSERAARLTRDAADRWALAILSAGFAVASALMVGASMGQILGISGVSFFGFLLSALLALWLFLKLLRD